MALGGLVSFWESDRTEDSSPVFDAQNLTDGALTCCAGPDGDLESFLSWLLAFSKTFISIGAS